MANELNYSPSHVYVVIVRNGYKLWVAEIKAFAYEAPAIKYEQTLRELGHHDYIDIVRLEIR